MHKTDLSICLCNNNKLSLVIEESLKDSGEVIQLLPTLRQTIQPKVLLRLGVFVPTLKSTDKGGRKSHRIDATEPFRDYPLWR